MKKLPSSGRVYSPILKLWIKIDHVISNTQWYFINPCVGCPRDHKHNSEIVKSEIPLSWFIDRHLWQEEI